MLLRAPFDSKSIDCYGLNGAAKLWAYNFTCFDTNADLVKVVCSNTLPYAVLYLNLNQGGRAAIHVIDLNTGILIEMYRFEAPHLDSLIMSHFGTHVLMAHCRYSDMKHVKVLPLVRPEPEEASAAS